MPNIDLKVPEAGESIRSGILAKWYVKSGDLVRKDQLLYEFETEKITSEVLSPESGKITLQAENGAEVQVGQVIAVIDTDVEVPKEEVSGSSEKPAEEKRPVKEETKPQAGVSASTEASRRKDKKDESSPSAAGEEASSGRTTRRPLTPIRQKIANQMVSAKNETAMLTTFNEVDMSTVNKIRADHKEAFLEKHGVKLGMLSFFTKAVVSALKAVPSINTQLSEDSIIENHYYDIGVAVSTDKGLLVPVIRDCDTASHADLERQVADLASRARTNKLTFADLAGGVFTITNGGVYGSLMSTPILNPPQCAILGLHAIKDRPIAVDGQVLIRPMMYIALSYDHRLVDGREAVTFLLHIKDYMEKPEMPVI